MVAIAFAAMLAAVLGLAVGEMDPTENYPNEATLSQDRYKIYWKFTDKDITFEIHARTKGWIGIGFSPNGAMDHSDIFIGWVKDGKVEISDRHGIDRNGYPPVDPKQDVDVISGMECDDWTVIKFRRQLAACESNYDREITGSTERVIWALGEDDPAEPDSRPAYHGYGTMHRGVAPLYLLDIQVHEDIDDEEKDFEYFDVLAGNFNVPPVDTYYNCRTFKVKEVPSKRHIVEYDAIIQKRNEQHVHHIIVYRCDNSIANVYNGTTDGYCYDYSDPHFQLCTRVIAIWAVGSTGYRYPKNAGYSIGADGDPLYIRMEVHYDNPMKSSGIFDNSGIRFIYTSRIRKHDIGIMTVGATLHSFFIPPQSESFKTVGYCTSSCFQEMMAAANISSVTMFGAALHSHLAGRAIKLRHIRNGTELRYIANDETYDFNYQQSRHINPPIELLPGDSIQTECIYNTMDRENITLAGYGTYEEMCFGFIYYYPRMNFGYCSTNPNFKQKYRFFKIWNYANGFTMKERVIRRPKTKKGETIYDVVSKYSWNDQKRARYEAKLQSLNQFQLCAPEQKFTMTTKFVSPPKITQPYQEPHAVCVPSTSNTASVTAKSCVEASNKD